jgi:hypothetical protein
MFWNGESLSPLEQVCIKSFIAHGHRIHLFTYNKNVVVPQGVIVESASEILPVDRLFIFENSPSAFSNIFRYKLLFDKGGWWIDTDVINLKGKLPDCDFYWACEQPGRINGAVLKFPPAHPVSEKLLVLSQERSANLTRWGQLGPDLLTEVLSGYAPSRLSGSTQKTYPIHWLESHFPWLPEFLYQVDTRIERADFLHLWHSCLTQMGLNVQAQPPFGSFLFKLYKDYAIRTQTLIDVDDLRKSIGQFLTSRDWRPYSSFEINMDSLLPLLKWSSTEQTLDVYTTNVRTELNKERFLRVALESEIIRQKTIVEKLRRKSHRTHQENKALKAKLTSVQASLSWRLTAPLRWLRKAFLRKRKTSKAAIASQTS